MKVILSKKSSNAAVNTLMHGLALGVAMAPLQATDQIHFCSPNGVTVTSLSHHFEVPKETRFQIVLRKWREATEVISNPMEACSSPYFHEIVQMGSSAYTLILDEIKRDPDVSLLAALEKITGVDPISPDAYGDLEKMVCSWIDWDNEHRKGETISG
jgi:hypothetical protein